MSVFGMTLLKLNLQPYSLLPSPAEFQDVSSSLPQWYKSYPLFLITE